MLGASRTCSNVEANVRCSDKLLAGIQNKPLQGRRWCRTPAAVACGHVSMGTRTEQALEQQRTSQFSSLQREAGRYCA